MQEIDGLAREGLNPPVRSIERSVRERRFLTESIPMNNTIYLEIASDFIDEEFPAVLSRIFNALCSYFILDISQDLGRFIVGEKSIDFTRCKQIIDQDEKLLIGHLRIRHQKDSRNILDACTDVQIVQVLEHASDDHLFATSFIRRTSFRSAMPYPLRMVI